MLNTIATKVKLQLNKTEKEDAKAKEEDELSQYTSVIDVIGASRAEEERIKQAAEAQRTAAVAEFDAVRAQLRAAEDAGDEEAEGRLDTLKSALRARTRNDCGEMREEEEKQLAAAKKEFTRLAGLVRRRLLADAHAETERKQKRKTTKDKRKQNVSFVGIMFLLKLFVLEKRTKGARADTVGTAADADANATTADEDNAQEGTGVA